MDPMHDFVRERTADLQRTAEKLHRDRDLRRPDAVGVAMVAGRITRPTPIPTTAPAAVTSTPATVETCGPCPTDTARQAA